MTDSLDIPTSALDQVPAGVRAALARSSSTDRTRKLTAEQQERVAQEVLACGVGLRSPAFVYLILRLRHGLGVGVRPTPPSMQRHELAYVDQKVEQIIAALAANAGRRA